MVALAALLADGFIVAGWVLGYRMDSRNNDDDIQ